MISLRSSGGTKSVDKAGTGNNMSILMLSIRNQCTRRTDFGIVFPPERRHLLKGAIKKIPKR